MFVVPVFQAPDEDTHFDYAITYYAAGRPVAAWERKLEPGLHGSRANPLTAFLEDANYFDVIRHRPRVKAPPGYGTAGYYANLDRQAPAVSPQQMNPWVSARDPFLQPALTALWMAGVHLVDPSPLALFFGARMLSVALLAVSLFVTYLLYLQLGVERTRALLLTGLVGLFPMSTFVSSQVQPAALSLTLAVLAMYSGMRLWRDPTSRRWALAVGLSLGGLWVTKGQYFLCVVVPVAGLIGYRWLGPGRPTRRETAIIAALTLAPPLLLESLNLWLTSFGHIRLTTDPNSSGNSIAVLATAVHEGPLAFGEALASDATLTFGDFFFYESSRSFWGDFGWLDTLLTVFTPWVRGVAELGSLAVVILVVIRLWRSARLWGRLWASGRRRRAWRLVFGNPLVAAYLLFTALMAGFHLLTAGTVGTQGRYWFPLLPGAFLLGTEYAPRAFRSRTLRIYAGRLAYGFLVGYCVFGSAVALPELSARYYGNGRAVAEVGPPPELPPAGGRGAILYVVPSGRDFTQPNYPLVPQGGYVAVTGWAAGPGSERPLAVWIVVDGAPKAQAVYGDDTPAPAADQAVPHLDRIGFDGMVRVGQAAVGPHRLSIAVLTREGRWLAPTGAFWVNVVPAT